jgi:type IV pilus assembly protein PilV
VNIHASNAPAVAGYTLIEVLIASAILLISMTGLMTMQLLSIKITHNSYHRTLATALAHDMTEYIRANCGIDGATALDYVGSTLCRDGYQNPADPRTCTLDDPSDIVTGEGTTLDDDLGTWWRALDASGIPNWYAEIARRNGIIHVVVQWDDSHATETSPDATDVKTSCLGNPLPGPMEEVCLATIPCG